YRKGFYEPDLDKKITYFNKARFLNPYQIVYINVLANTYLARLQNEVSKPQEEIDQNKLYQNTALALDWARRATRVFPNKVLAWQNLGNVYRNLRGIAQGAEEQAIQAYQKALELDPKNTTLYVEIGKLQTALDKDEEARQNFQKALEIDPEFIPAQIQLALLLEKEGKQDEAIAKLEEIVASYPLNIEANFQLGRLYYNNNEIDKAIQQLTQTLQLSPLHSNARFSLALAYEKKGEYQKAFDHIQIVAQLNPDNKTVQDKLEELRKKAGTLKEEEK
ncbi:tetratricopeptide repeat protein, partial [bacterium]|nr:tetratricopeptide repeat protein [bacterium]